MTSTTRPASGPIPAAASTTWAISSGSAIRPIPTSPEARGPSTGPANQTPRRFRVSTCWRVASCPHMTECMAGATTTGPANARAVVVRKSSPSPRARRARTFAVAGATHSTSPQAAAVMCDSSPEPVGVRYSS